MPQSIKSKWGEKKKCRGGEAGGKEKKSKEKLAVDYCQRHQRSSIYGRIYSSAAVAGDGGGRWESTSEWSSREKRLPC